MPTLDSVDVKVNMFSDHTSEATEFRSSWRQTRSVMEGGCQTERQETREATAQSTIYDEAGTQTEERDAVRLKQEHNEESFQVISRVTAIYPQSEGNLLDLTKQLNAPSLIKFLSHAAPLIEYELSAAARSRAFDGYALIEDEGEKQARKNSHTDRNFRYDFISRPKRQTEGYRGSTWLG